MAGTSSSSRPSKKSKKTASKRMDEIRLRNDEEREEYDRLINHVHKTRWYSRAEGEHLGIHVDISEAFSYIGAECLLDASKMHYPVLTAEFMATVSAQLDSVASDDEIDFQLGNVCYSITLAGLNDLLGFPHPTEDYDMPEFHVDETWGYIIGQSGCPCTALPGREIVNPLFRIILRILGSTIWPKKELSRPTRWEIACLRCMLFQVPHPLNLGYEWLKAVTDFKGKGSELWFRGMIARLARALQVDLTTYNARATHFIDAAYLIQAQILTKRGRSYTSTYHGKAVTLTSERVDLLYLPNWYETWSPAPFSLSTRLEDDPQLRRREPRYHHEEPVYEPQHYTEGVGNDLPGVGTDFTAEYEESMFGGFHSSQAHHRAQYFSEGAGTSASGSAPPPDMATLSAQMNMLMAGQQRLHDELTEFRQDFEEQQRVDDHRWYTTASFVHWMTEVHADQPYWQPPPPPPPGPRCRRDRRQ